jgi:hypothetical protein
MTNEMSQANPLCGVPELLRGNAATALQAAEAKEALGREQGMTLDSAFPNRADLHRAGCKTSN